MSVNTAANVSQAENSLQETLEQILADIRAMWMEIRKLKRMMQQAIDDKNEGELVELENNFPFKLPLNYIDFEIAEDFVQTKQNYDEVVSILFFLPIRALIIVILIHSCYLYQNSYARTKSKIRSRCFEVFLRMKYSTKLDGCVVELLNCFLSGKYFYV